MNTEPFPKSLAQSKNPPCTWRSIAGLEFYFNSIFFSFLKVSYTGLVSPAAWPNGPIVLSSDHITWFQLEFPWCLFFRATSSKQLVVLDVVFCKLNLKLGNPNYQLNIAIQFKKQLFLIHNTPSSWLRIWKVCSCQFASWQIGMNEMSTKNIEDGP